MPRGFKIKANAKAAAMHRTMAVIFTLPRRTGVGVGAISGEIMTWVCKNAGTLSKKRTGGRKENRILETNVHAGILAIPRARMGRGGIREGFVVDLVIRGHIVADPRDR